MDDLERLIQQYTRELPEKASVLQRQVQNAIHALGAGQTPSWDTLEFVAHKLAGSSGIYGFIPLSTVIRTLEESISEKRLPKLKSEQAIRFLQEWCASFDSTLRTSLEEKQRAA